MLRFQLYLENSDKESSLHSKSTDQVVFSFRYTNMAPSEGQE